MLSLRKAAVLATASFTAFALAACGSEPGAGGAAQKANPLEQLINDATGSLRRTVDDTKKANSVAFTMTGTIAGQTMDAKGRMAFVDPIKAEMTVNDPKEGETTVRIIGSTFYVAIPEAERAEMDGKKWLKMDLSGLGANSDELTRQFQNMDPVKGVETLLNGKSVTVVGEETVDGVRTVHYSAVGTVESYLELQDEATRKSVQEQFTKAGVTEIKADAWVDEKYQPRRVHMVMGSVGDFTMNYTDYGTAVAVEVPPVSETLDFKEMLDGLKDLTAGG